MSQHVAGSRLTSNIKITLKIKFTSEIFADMTRSLVVVLQRLRFCKNSADNTMENRATSLVESSGDNSLISCPNSSILFIKDSLEGILEPVTDIINCSLIMSIYPVAFQKLVRLPHNFLSGALFFPKKMASRRLVLGRGGGGGGGGGNKLRTLTNFPYPCLPEKGVQIPQFHQFLLLGPPVANILTFYN